MSVSYPRPDRIPPSGTNLESIPSQRGLLYTFCHHYCGEETHDPEGELTDRWSYEKDTRFVFYQYPAMLWTC